MLANCGTIREQHGHTAFGRRGAEKSLNHVRRQIWLLLRSLISTIAAGHPLSIRKSITGTSAPGTLRRVGAK
jgi:hypothetical protein